MKTVLNATLRKDPLERIRAKATFYDLAFAGVFAVGLSKLYFVLQNWIFNIIEISLLVFTFGLLIEFWYFCSSKPGFITKYRSDSLTEYCFGIITIVGFVGLFATTHIPIRYILFVEVVFFFDALWTRQHGKFMKKKRVSMKKLRQKSIIVILDAMICLMFIVYYVFYTQVDKGQDIIVDLCLTFAICITVTAFVIQYRLVLKAIK